MKIKSLWLRRIHKWVGLVIGLQFLAWAISGTAMALLDMEDVAGGPVAETAPPAPPAPIGAWPTISRSLTGSGVTALRLHTIQGRQLVEVTSGEEVRLFDAGTGQPVAIDRAAAIDIARASNPTDAQVKRAVPLKEVTLAVREHQLPIWRVDFADPANSSYYVSGKSGEVLERRNDSWRIWDFFWMLHNMDYAQRTSFNHPLIIIAGFAMAWVAGTGFWLLFRTMWRHDFISLRGRFSEARSKRPTVRP